MDKPIQREKIRRLARWAKGEPQPPVRIDLEPTLACNLKCKFCWQRSEDRLNQCNYSNPLTEKRILEIIDEAAALGVKEWQIAGGWEPMVKPEFAMKIMRRIKKHKMYGCITTNGTLFKENYIKELVKIKWDQILFSLEGADAKTHDYLVGKKGSFEKSVQAMRLFKKYKKLYRKKKPIYSFHTVLMNKNYKQLKKMVQWGRDLGCEGVMFEPINVWSEDGEKLKLNSKQKEEMTKYIEEALELSKELNLPTNLASLLEKRLIDKGKMDKVIESDIENVKLNNASKRSKSNENKFLELPCFEPWLNLEIRISGHVVPCRLCDTHQYANKIHNKSLKDIWYGPYFKRIRKRMLNNDLPRYCRTCAAGVILDMRKIRGEINRLDNSIIYKLKNKITNKKRTK
jgi:MoaA/NifB/PqqE/SkfB family radical SAM enzyme